MPSLKMISRRVSAFWLRDLRLRKLRDDLSKVTYLIDLSTKTMSVVRENVTAAILIKASFAVLAFPTENQSGLPSGSVTRG